MSGTTSKFNLFTCLFDRESVPLKEKGKKCHIKTISIYGYKNDGVANRPLPYGVLLCKSSHVSFIHGDGKGSVVLEHIT